MSAGLETPLETREAPAPGAREVAGVPFPTLIECTTPDAGPEDARAWLRSRRDALLARVGRDGAVFLRGFPLASAWDFDAVVAAFDLPPFPYAESLSNAVRIDVTPRVCTANEAPPDASIRLHHELAQTPVHPSRLFFFCEQPPARGGSTPLCRSDALYAALAREEPGFAEACRTRGLRYSHVMPEQDDPGSALGRSWHGTLGVADRAAAEARLRRLGYTWEWLPDGSLRATTPVLPAVREAGPGRLSFFNQLVATLGWRDARNDPETALRFGDGSPVDLALRARVGELAEGLAVDVPWRRGDVLLVDNGLVLHGRRPFEGSRRVLASLVAADRPGPAAV